LAAAHTAARVQMKENKLKFRKSKRSAIPGLGISLGFTLIYLSLIVLIPLAALVIQSTTLGWDHFYRATASPRVLASYRVTIGTAFVAAAINTFAGLLIGWVLARYKFPGRRIVDALVDLPFALPTAVAGIALVSLYVPNGWIGQFLEPHGIKVAFTAIGITLAMAFVGLPFVVRSVQPVIEDLDPELEEAAHSLGANSLQTFTKVIFPAIFPALLTGAGLAFARALGEYGSVIFIAGNMPMKTEITALLIVSKLEEYDYVGATAVATVLLIASFLMVLVLNLIQARSRRFQEVGITKE
jgi:sulfate transport system permease protein